MSMTNLFVSFLSIVEQAIQNPENKAAVNIARDGLIMWNKIATIPEVLQFEADIGAYEKLVAARAPEQAPSAPIIETPYVAPAHQSPAEFNADPRNR